MKLVSQTGLIGSILTIADAMDLARKLIDPALDGSSVEMVWSPDSTSWEVKG